MHRRSFLATALGTLAIAPVDRLFALAPDSPFHNKIGIQLYTLRDALGKDASGTLKQVADAGYHQVEAYGFPDCQPLIDAAKEHGLALNSTHFEWTSVTKPSDAGMSDFKKIVEQAEKLKLSDLVVPYLHADERNGLDGYRKLAERFNRAAAITKDAGIRLGYHNHSFEFAPLEDDKSGYDIFIKEFGPDMYFEIDVFWVNVAGHDSAELIAKLDRRVTQLHLKDLKKDAEIPNYGSPPQDAFKELGNGMIPMEPILAAAAKHGVTHCHVEQDHSPDPLASIRESMTYLKSL